MIKIFDSCAHPTLSGKFNKLNSDFENLQKSMKKNKIYKAFAIGLDSFENYEHKMFIKKCNEFKNLVPIAGINPIKNQRTILNELKLIKKLGYKGVKIHNRISKFDISDKKLVSFFKLLEEFNLLCLVCCYWHSNINTYPKKDFFYSLLAAFKNIKKLKIILMHGGNVRLLEFAEFVRSNKNNFLLDLSMTMIKYEGSSIDNDIKFLFKKFDERICIGSDHPEYSYNKLRQRFNFFSKNLNNKKRKNIAYLNLENFLNDK